MLASVDNLANLQIESAVKAMERSTAAVSIFKGPGDSVGKTAVSEFGVVLSEVGSQGEIWFARCVMSKNDEFTISVGVASYSEHGREAGHLLALAKSALGASINRGGNRVSVPQTPLDGTRQPPGPFSPVTD